MGNLILVLAVVLILGLSVLFGMLRGLAKSRIRGICVLVSGVLAVVATLLFKSKIVSEDFINEIILPWLRDLGQAEIKEMLEISPTLNEVVLKCLSSLVAPLLCLVFFLLILLVSWVIYLIITLIFSEHLRAHNERAAFRLPRALAWGGVQGLILVLMLLLPVSAYLEIAPDAMEAVLETDIMDEQSEETVSDILENTIKPLNESGTVTVYRVLGGRGLGCLITDFKIGGEKTHLADEIDSVAAFACNISRLVQTEFTAYSSDEAVIFVAVADSFEDSVLLPTIAGEIIYGATDAWLNDNAFLGVERPVLEDADMQSVTDPFFTALLRVLHADARNYPALQRDIRTVADMIATLANHEVFSKIEDTDALMRAISSNGIIGELISSLGANESMKVLIPEITNMGVRAIAMTLNIPADMTAVYGDFLDEVAASLNSAKKLKGEAQIEAVSLKLTNAFDNAGISVDQELIDCYSISMIEDLIEESGEEDVTSEDVQAFFTVYSATVSEEASLSAVVSSGSLEGTVYENKSESELEESGAATLADALQQLSSLEAGDDISTEAKNLLRTVYSNLTDDVSVQKVLNALDIDEPVSVDMVDVTATLQSAETLQSQRVTLEDLLIDPVGSAEKITSETLQGEANAIDEIFVAASELTDSMGTGETIKLTEVSGAVGSILDSLEKSKVYGSEQTASLFTAVLQSELVRDTAKLDMSTATQMANKATEGDVDYRATMNSVAQSVTVFTELGESGTRADEEDLAELIDNLNPQTAGMLEVYVTTDRIQDYGVSSKYSGTSADLLSSTFGYMADNELEDQEAEAKALNQVLDIAISANSHSSGKQLFSDDDREGILPSAAETVSTFMASESVTHSLRENILDENGNVIEEKQDAFDLGRKMTEGSDEYNEFVAALDASYEADPTEETKQSLTALAALFGVAYS